MKLGPAVFLVCLVAACSASRATYADTSFSARVHELSDKIWKLNEDLLEYDLKLPINFDDPQSSQNSRCIADLMDFSSDLTIDDVKALADAHDQVVDPRDRKILSADLKVAITSRLRRIATSMKMQPYTMRAHSCDHNKLYAEKQKAVLGTVDQITKTFTMILASTD